MAYPGQKGPLTLIHICPLQPSCLLGLSHFPITFSFHHSNHLPVYLVIFYVLVVCDRTPPTIYVLSDSFLFALVYAIIARDSKSFTCMCSFNLVPDFRPVSSTYTRSQFFVWYAFYYPCFDFFRLFIFRIY